MITASRKNTALQSGRRLRLRSSVRSLHLDEASDAAELENCYHRLLEQKLSHSSIKGKIARLFNQGFAMPTGRESARWTNP